MNDLPQPSNLKPIYDFGRTSEEVEASKSRPAPTAAQIAAMIVDATDLAALGRWAGLPAPRRRLPGR